MKAFTPYTSHGPGETPGYTIYFPVEDIAPISGPVQAVPFVGWIFYPDDQGKVSDSSQFWPLRKLRFRVDDTDKYRWDINEMTSNRVKQEMIQTIFEYYRDKHG